MDLEVERLRSQVKELQAWVLDLLAENKTLRLQRELHDFAPDPGAAPEPVQPSPS